MTVYELNLDGLVGPSHHYAGLGVGNLASTKNALKISNPKDAALQGIAKMRLLHQLGIKQAFLPPHQRPNLGLLQQLGFSGAAAQQLRKASLTPQLLSACYSSSFMWSANAATVSSSMDTADQRIHFTAANLISNLHRHQESAFTKKLLTTIFADANHFVHHPLLPSSFNTSDEGAANHSRLCKKHSHEGVHLFVYGKQALNGLQDQGPIKFPARQTLEASQAIARAHKLNPEKIIFARQNPHVIDQGVFHHDVIGVANESLLFIHEEALINQNAVYHQLHAKADFEINIIEVKTSEISVCEVVESYLFNSQLITLPDEKSMVLIAPIECKMNNKIKHYIEALLADSSNPLIKVYYLNLKQSMQNGGGPACLRLRIPLTEEELSSMNQAVLINQTVLEQLESWVNRHYRSQLQIDDLADPQFMNDCFTALDELSQLLQLGSIYYFQREAND